MERKKHLGKSYGYYIGRCVCIWLIFEMLSRTGKLAFADLICIALCVICICEAVSFWNTKRVLSYVAIGGIILTLVAVILQMLLFG